MVVTGKDDGSSGARGNKYEACVCMLCAVRGYTRGLTDFQLRYQVSNGGKFDDVAFDKGDGKYQMIQLKHKENKKQISHSHLFSKKENTDYNLIKYVVAFSEIDSSEQFKDKIKMAVVFTNIDINLKNNRLDLTRQKMSSSNKWYNGATSIELTPVTLDADCIFDLSNVFHEAKYFNFAGDANIVQILKRQMESLKKKPKSNSWWERIRAYIQRLMTDHNNKKQQAVIDNDNIIENGFRRALQHIVYAVNQPNDKKLEEIIKKEIMDHFKLQSPDTIYSELEKWFRDWCDTKESVKRPQEPTTTSNQSALPIKQHTICYKDVDEFFQKTIKRFSFGVTAPTRSFTGRVNELDDIRAKLNEKPDLIVSQCVTVSGLGGIGKTELMRQFIKKFGISDFYGRVIWIAAESDETVKISFIEVAQKLEIKDIAGMKTKVLIDKVIEYFHGFKVLFVFDNFDKIPGGKSGT